MFPSTKGAVVKYMERKLHIFIQYLNKYLLSAQSYIIVRFLLPWLPILIHQNFYVHKELESLKENSFSDPIILRLSGVIQEKRRRHTLH